jgi:hypothetical protein
VGWYSLREALWRFLEGGGYAFCLCEGSEDRAEAGEIHCGVWRGVLAVVNVVMRGVGDFVMDGGRCRCQEVLAAEVRLHECAGVERDDCMVNNAVLSFH